MAEPGAAPKRIAFFLPNMVGGGAERVALAGITDLVERGHEVDLVLIRAEGDLLPLVPRQVNVIDLKAGRIFSSLLPLARYLRERKPDALHALMWPVTIIAILARSLARSRALLVVSDHTQLSRHVAGARQLAALRWTTRLLYPRADLRIASSDGTAGDLAALSGIARERFTVIPSPISPPATIATNPQVEQLWGDAKPRIITVGSMKPEKNQALLLRAFAQLHGHLRAKLTVLGEGPLRSRLEGLARELGIADRVLMPGFAIDPWPYLASADLFVLSSDYEGFGLALVEAMYAGLAVVSTDCEAGPREILDDGRFGTLVPVDDPAALANAMEEALANTQDPSASRIRAMQLSGESVRVYGDLMIDGRDHNGQV